MTKLQVETLEGFFMVFYYFINMTPSAKISCASSSIVHKKMNILRYDSANVTCWTASDTIHRISVARVCTLTHCNGKKAKLDAGFKPNLPLQLVYFAFCRFQTAMSMRTTYAKLSAATRHTVNILLGSYLFQLGKSKPTGADLLHTSPIGQRENSRV